MDIKTINIPDLETEHGNANIYIYAEYLRPGYHQLLIYDPLIDKAYCKDFIVNLNTREDMYPEYPIIEGMKMGKGIKNVFECWYNDDDDQRRKAMEIDQEGTINFSLEHLTKDLDDEEKVIGFM